MYKKIFSTLLFIVSVHFIQAQHVGIGAQFGEPTGITLRINNGGALGYDILAAWDLDNYFFINVHGLWEHRLAPSPRIGYFYGPGVFAGVRERGKWEDNDVYLGVSGTIGLNVYIQKLEIFGQITPRLAIAPGTSGDIGGGIGLRFYFN